MVMITAGLLGAAELYYVVSRLQVLDVGNLAVICNAMVVVSCPVVKFRLVRKDAKGFKAPGGWRRRRVWKWSSD